MSTALCAVFFASGVAGLVFETLWFHQTGLALGNSIHATSLVLAAFMGGLALGNAVAAAFGDRLRRPLSTYAALEVLIGVAGVALVWLLPVLTPVLAPLLRPLQGDPWALNAVRTTAAFVLMLVPSVAMGATLPLLVRTLFFNDPRFGSVLGRLYGWNTLGAVVGAISGDAFWIGWLGIRGTALCAAGLNGAVAVVALAVARWQRARSTTPDNRPLGPARPLSRRAWRLLAAAFGSGAALLALEIVWFRFLLLSVSGTALAFAVMLAVVLAGIGLGGLLGSLWLARRPGAFAHASSVALWTGIACVSTYAFFDAAPRSFGMRPALTGWEILEVAAPLMLPASALSGLLFPLLGQALHEEIASPMRAAGLLTLANTVGAMCGSLFGGFVLLPGIGIEASLAGLAASYGGTALLCLPAGWRPATRAAARTLAVSVAALALCLALFPRGAMEERFLARLVSRFVQYEPVLVREALTETIIYLRRDLFGEPYIWRLLTNSHSMSSTSTRDQRYMTLFVYWPVAVHPEVRSALLISYGLGVTARALVETDELESLDIVDISSAILETNRLLYPEAGTFPLDDPRVRVHVEDGRHFLQTTNQRFDLITGEPPPPKLAGIVNLYTREYFGLVHDRLARGGITTYWLPTKGLFESDARSIIRAFCDVFADCSLWAGAGFDWMLVGSKGGLEPIEEERLSQQFRNPKVAARMRDIGLERAEQLGALFLADAAQLGTLTADALPLEDDHPKRLRDEIPNPQEFFREFMRSERARSRFRESAFVAKLWPASLREPTLAAFDDQALLEQTISQQVGDLAKRFAALDHVLRETSLKTLAVWIAGSDAAAGRAAEAGHGAGREGLGIDFHRAVDALARRDYAQAARLFERSRHRPLAADRRELLYYEIYALCLAGRLADARSLGDKAGIGRSARPQDQAFDAFLATRFRWRS